MSPLRQRRRRAYSAAAVVVAATVADDVPEQTRRENVCGPVFDGQTLYLCVDDQVQAYDARNGKLRWRWQAPPTYVDRWTRNRWPGRLSTPLFYGSTRFGWNTGLGTRLYTWGVTSFLEARYHRTTRAGAGVHYIPVTFGLLF